MQALQTCLDEARQADQQHTNIADKLLGAGSQRSTVGFQRLGPRARRESRAMMNGRRAARATVPHGYSRQFASPVKKQGRTPDLLTFVETDFSITLTEQVEDQGGQVVLIITSVVAPEEAWSADVALLKRQPCVILAQLHSGRAGCGALLNYALWKLVSHRNAGLASPELKAQCAKWPDGAKASSYLFRPIAVSGLSEA